MRIILFLIDNHPSDIKYVVVVDRDDEIACLAKKHDYEIISAADITERNAAELLGEVEYIFLAWWPEIIPQFIIDIPSQGVVNTHPSFLPYNRGKNYNFWTIVEDTPFGVTLHFVDSGIDSGGILFQEKIAKTWEDNGETLYCKAKEAMLNLFEDAYPKIMNGEYVVKKQDHSVGTFHNSSEMDEACRIELDNRYTGRELLNLLRGRSFSGKPACYFTEDGQRFEVRIRISEVGVKQSLVRGRVQ